VARRRASEGKRRTGRAGAIDCALRVFIIIIIFHENIIHTYIRVIWVYNVFSVLLYNVEIIWVSTPRYCLVCGQVVIGRSVVGRCIPTYYNIYKYYIVGIYIYIILLL